MSDALLVTAVIPTRGRPELAPRAVHSVLAQTHQHVEVVVVVDGPDPATLEALGKIRDPRLRVIALPQSVGGSDARNSGVQNARGRWIAFLDDDDEWVPEKLQTQLAIALSADYPEPVVSSRFLARESAGRCRVLPQRLPSPAEPISDYLLVRNSIRRAEGYVLTSTILASRELLLRVPFRSGLKRHQDWDWVLRVSREPGVGIVFSPEPLTIYHTENNHSTSRSTDWRFSLDWIHRNRLLVSARAYASFVTCHVAWQAAADHAWVAFFPLLVDAASNGSITAVDLVRYAGFWFVPNPVRRTFR